MYDTAADIRTPEDAGEVAFGFDSLDAPFDMLQEGIEQEQAALLLDFLETGRRLSRILSRRLCRWRAEELGPNFWLRVARVKSPDRRACSISKSCGWWQTVHLGMEFLRNQGQGSVVSKSKKVSCFVFRVSSKR
jgi:hypothetical protein